MIPFFYKVDSVDGRGFHHCTVRSEKSRIINTSEDMEKFKIGEWMLFEIKGGDIDEADTESNALRD